MLFQRKLDRARELQREQRGLDREDREPGEEELGEFDPSEYKEEQLRPEKGDIFSMLVSAFLTLFLPAALVLLAFGGLLWLLTLIW